jgi:hypothetical protein
VKPRQQGGPGPLAAFVPWNVLFSIFYVTEMYSFMLESSTQRQWRKTAGRNRSYTATFLEEEQHVDFKWSSSEEQGPKVSQKSRI